MKQPTAFDLPLATSEICLTDAQRAYIEDAVAILGSHPNPADVDRHFRVASGRTTVRGRMKRAFWARVVDSSRLQAHSSIPTTVYSPGISPVGHPCVYCGEPAEEIDHVWPRVRGGDDHPNNLVRACARCNGVKSHKSILGAACPDCGHQRDPGDVDTATGRAFYSCRCGTNWSRLWDLQAVPFTA